MAEAVLIEKAYILLTENRYPKGATKAARRSIRKKAETLTVIDGVPYHQKKNGKKVELIMDSEERMQIVKSCHCATGHMGRKRTLARVTEKFVWPGMAKDVQKLTETCDVCQKSQPCKKIHTASAELHQVPVVLPWDHLSISIIGPITASTQGFHYILTILDYFTKFVQAIPMETKHVSEVVAALYKIFLVFGFPKVITSDLGGKFQNDLHKNLGLIGIHDLQPTPHHHQGNGLDKHFKHQSQIQNMLTKFVEEKKENWQDSLDTYVFSYNTSKHESYKYSPFEAMYGRVGVPVDLKR